jgi:hypothetical protein
MQWIIATIEQENRHEPSTCWAWAAKPLKLVASAGMASTTAGAANPLKSRFKLLRLANNAILETLGEQDQMRKLNPLI